EGVGDTRTRASRIQEGHLLRRSPLSRIPCRAHPARRPAGRGPDGWSRVRGTTFLAVRPPMSRLEALVRLYALLDRLESKLGAKRALDRLGPARGWPDRGVYFFFDPGEFRTDSGTGPRLVRVGTHALSDGAKSTLHQRLRQHGGQSSGGGNHRGSI